MPMGLLLQWTLDNNGDTTVDQILSMRSNYSFNRQWIVAVQFTAMLVVLFTL
jgi:hypothetical protein